MAMAKILEQRSYIVPGKLKITEHFFEVPVDHSKPDGPQLRLFGRSCEKNEKPVEPAKDEPKQTPWRICLYSLLYDSRAELESQSCTYKVVRGYQLFFPDQRGTGMSSTITTATLAKQGSPADQAAYIKHFRADSIVKDMEAIRKVFTKDYPENKKKWSALGQSFGGFCIVNYLSRFPEGLQEVFLTGGLPPLVKQPDAVYERLFRRMADRSHAYYQKFPEDVQRMKDIAGHLTKEEVKTNTGGIVSVSRLRQFGFILGFHGSFDVIHGILLQMTNDLSMFGFLTRPTIQNFDNLGPFETHVLYALVHEPCYLSGAASNWSAERTIHKFPEFGACTADSADPILFTSEMIFKSMFNDFAELRPLYETMDIIQHISDWPDLYDEAQLAKNEVPAYAAVYLNDLYVDYEYSSETARKIKGCKTFVRSDLYHEALGSKSAEVVEQLFKLRDDVLD
ncbi:hypothetical protein MMC17_007885 [Xylographa soralifera]|nr:hypothetical protein [Xylographa soralifera]